MIRYYKFSFGFNVLLVLILICIIIKFVLSNPIYNNPKPVHIVTFGNSLTFGEQGKINPKPVNPITQSWPAQMLSLLGNGYTLTNLAKSGKTAEQIRDEQISQASANYVKGDINIAIINDWTNSGRLGESGDQCYSVTKQSVKTLKAAGYLVIVETAPAFNDNLDAFNKNPIAVDQLRQNYNTLISQRWQSDLGAKGLIDVTSISDFGHYVGPGKQNTNYYQEDGAHLTKTGYGILAVLAVPAVQTVARGATYGVQYSN